MFEIFILNEDTTTTTDTTPSTTDQTTVSSDMTQVINHLSNIETYQIAQFVFIGVVVGVLLGNQLWKFIRGNL